jgi:hypothetical protein
MIVFALLGIYVVFCILLLVKSRSAGHSDSGTSFSQKKATQKGGILFIN